jgi:capsular polysaccharide biosynthesis protein
LFGPNTKTVEIYLGHTYNSYITSGVNYFLRKKIKNIKNGVYYSIQVREDQNYYHFLLLLAPAILRVFNFCLKNEIEVIFLVPKSAPKFLQDFLQTIPIKTQTISKKNAELENVILTTIYSGDSPHPLDIKSLNEHARQILKNESVSTSNFSNKKYISTKLIYVSRKNQSRYSKIDEKIEKILIKAGFFILRPEEFTLQQQVYFFNNSKLVIGNHGAGLANLVFCKKGTQVIELAVIEIQINDWMKNLSQILEIDYNYLEIKEESDLSELSNLVSMLKRKVDES